MLGCATVATTLMLAAAARAAVTATSNGQELSGVTTITGTLVPPSTFTLSQGGSGQALKTNQLAGDGISLTQLTGAEYGGPYGDSGQDNLTLNVNGLYMKGESNGEDHWNGRIMSLSSWGGLSGTLFGYSQKNLDYAIRPFSEGGYMQPSKAGIKFMAHNLGDLYYDPVKLPPVYIFYGHQTTTIAQTIGLSGDPATRLANIESNLKPMMELGGTNHLLKLIHISDNTKSIIMNPTAGSITIHGNAVLTTADAAAFAQQSALAALQTSVTTGYVAKSADTLAIGTGTTAGDHGFAIGALAIAGEGAISFGTMAGNNETPASGAYSISLGHQSHGEGAQSIAIGKSGWAGAIDAIAVGHESAALSVNSVAVGRLAVATKWGQVVLGAFNDPMDNTISNTPGPLDIIFAIGNGTSDTSRSNALVVNRSGDTEVAGTLKAGGKTVLTQGTGGSAFLTSTEIGASYIDATELAAALAADRTTSNGLYLTPEAAGMTFLDKTTAQDDYLKKDDAAAAYTDATELENALENYQQKNAAISTSASATVGGALTATGLATLNGGATVVGSTVVTGTLSVGGTGGTNGTLTAKKIRVPAGGDLPMDPAFTADGGLGAP